MGGRDKTRLPVRDSTLLDAVLSAVPSAAHVVVVGEPRPAFRDVTWTREDPPHAGPAAAVAAGLPLVRSGVTVLLAADLPFLTAEYVATLAAGVDHATGVVPVDVDGVEQWLCSAWPTALLRGVDWRATRSMRAGLGGLTARR